MTKYKQIKFRDNIHLAYFGAIANFPNKTFPVTIKDAYILILNGDYKEGDANLQTFEQIQKVINQVSNKKKSLIIFNNRWKVFDDKVSISSKEISFNLNPLFELHKDLNNSYQNQINVPEKSKWEERARLIQRYKMDLLLQELNLVLHKRKIFYIPINGKITDREEILFNYRIKKKKEINKIKVYFFDSSTQNDSINQLADISGAKVFNKISSSKAIDIKYLGFIKKMSIQRYKMILSY